MRKVNLHGQSAFQREDNHIRPLILHQHSSHMHRCVHPRPRRDRCKTDFQNIGKGYIYIQLIYIKVIHLISVNHEYLAAAYL